MISGGAGLKMGYALIATTGLSRLGSLRAAAPDLVVLIMGAAVMLLIAAGLEGYWSPSGLPNQVKWAFSALVSVFLIAYFALAGRDVQSAAGARTAKRPLAASATAAASGSMPPPSTGSMPPPSASSPPSSRAGMTW